MNECDTIGKDSGTPHERVRRTAVKWLNAHLADILPKTQNRAGKFRWELLTDPFQPSSGKKLAGEDRFDAQFWTANLNPSDRYVLSLPGTISCRISPLDYTYDNLTIAGDWTDCGLNVGCVESAIISGRLAAHAIAGAPALAEIVGYDHP